MEPQHARQRQPAERGAPTITPLEALFTGLRRALSDADAVILPDLLGRLESERLRAEVRLRQLASAAAAAPAEEPTGDDLLTLPQVAAFLGVTEDYAYSLARQRKIPTVRLPGLDRGGQPTVGKYVRVRRSALVEWLGAHVDNALDGANRVVPAVVRDAAPSSALSTCELSVRSSTNGAVR